MREVRPLQARRALRPPGGEAARTVQEMARLRQRLAEELEANLEQLRQVIADSQRLARELEAVLQQTRLAPVQLPSFRVRHQRRGAGGETAERMESGKERITGHSGLPGGDKG